LPESNQQVNDVINFGMSLLAVGFVLGMISPLTGAVSGSGQHRELSERQILKLRKALGLPKEVSAREKGYID